MKNISLIPCAVLLSLFVTVEARSAEPKPDWVDGQSLHYPEMTYLTGVGFGDDRQSAESSAYAAMARIFKSEIRSVTKESESFRQTESSQKETKIDRKLDIQQRTAVQSKIVLEQVKIAEHWLDPVAKVHYALAVLNRDKAAAAFRRKLLEAELEAKTWLARAGQAERPLLTAKALNQALVASRQADAYQAKLRVLTPDQASPLEESAMSADVQHQLNVLLNTHFQVEIVLEGPHAAEVEASVLEGLNRIGLTGGPDAKLAVTGVIRFEVTGPKSPVWHFVRWSTRITLTEKESGQVFGSIRRTGREGQLSPEEAEQKSLIALQSEVNKSIGKIVFQFIFGR